MPVLSLTQIEDLSLAALVGSGAHAASAAVVASSIREAEAQGIRNVGLAYLPTYCAHLRCGKVLGDAVATWQARAPGFLQVDAGLGFAHPAFMAALPDFVAMTQVQGVAVLGLTRSYSAGVLGWFIERLCEAGLVSLAFANASAMMAPYGGKLPVFGTNPLGFGVPRAQGAHIVADMSSTATARVNLLAAVKSGQPIPSGWAIDLDGRSTTDPQAALHGTMAPAAGHKGYMLALMVDVLAAGLTGANWSYEASSLMDDTGDPPGVGQCFIAIDPARFHPQFGERLAGLAQVIEAQDGAHLPGAGRAQRAALAQRQGVDVPADLIAQLQDFARATAVKDAP